MNLSGKKLTTAILAGLMGATVAGISVVGAVNPVVLDGTTLKVSTIKGTKPIMNPVNVTKGIIDGSTTGGNIVKSDSTVGANLDALDAAVVGKADKAELDTKANQTDFNALKTKVDNAKVNTALHVDKDGKLVVGTDKKVNKAVSVEKGFKDGTTEAGQGNIVSADNTVGRNLTALDNAIEANKQAVDNTLATKADKADLDNAKVNTALHVDKDGKLVVGTDKKVNKAVSVEKGFKDGTTEAGQGNIVSADNTVGQNLTALDNAVATNQKAISTETKERAAADKTLQDNIDAEATARDQAVAQERAERKGADAAQDKVIKQVNDNLVSSVNTINKNVADGFNALSAVDLQEAQTRAAADKTLQDNIDAEATARDQAVAQERAERKGADAAQDKVIKQVNDNLVSSVNTINKNVADGFNALSAVDLQEAQTRAAADKTLQDNIDAEATARDQAVAQERAERKGADAAQDKVIKQVNDNLVSSVNTINKNVADGFNALSAVDLQEAQTRAAADQTLQNQIANNAQAIGTTKDGNYVKSNNSVGQNLNVLDAQVGQNSANINQLFSDYSSMKTDINKVGARSAALAGLHPLDFDPANKLNFAVASGSFKGENSVALGAFYRPNENVMFSAASTMGDSDNAYTFGLSFKIGPSSAKTKTTSPDAEELYKVVGQLQDQLAAQQKEIEQLKAEKAAK